MNQRYSLPLTLIGIIAALWFALKDWIFSDAVPYPYGESTVTSLAIIGAAAAAMFVKRVDVWRVVFTAMATAACALAMLGLFWVRTLLGTSENPSLVQVPLLTNWLTTGGTLFSIGAWAMAFGLAPIISRLIRVVKERSRGVRSPALLHRLRDLSKARLTIDSLYYAALLGGLLCVVFSPTTGRSEWIECAVLVGIILVAEGAARGTVGGGNMAGRTTVRELCASALATIVVLSIHGLAFLNVLTMPIFYFSIASVAMAVFYRNPPVIGRPSLTSRQSIIAFCIIAMLAGFWIVPLFMLTARLSAGTQGAYSGPIPSSIDGVLESVPVYSWVDDHSLLRHYAGAHVSASPSMTGVIALQAVANGKPVSLTTLASVEMTEVILRCTLTTDKIWKLYLNVRDYGSSGGSARHIIGISSAARYYFDKQPGDLSPSEARYLLCSAPAYTIPSAAMETTPLAFGAGGQPSSQYEYRELETPKDLAYMMHDGCINAHGLVAGSVVTERHGNQPFLWKNGAYKMLSGQFDRWQGFVFGVNDAGISVGMSGYQAVRWDADGHVTELGTLPGFTCSRAMAINNLGQITGYAYNLTSQGSAIENSSRAFMWENGRMRDLGLPPGCSSIRAYSINNTGQIAGYLVTNQDKSHAFIWNAGSIHDIGTFPDGDLSVANDINSSGMVVGQGNHDDGTVSAFVWQNGTMHDLGTLAGDRYSRARSINDSGVVVGESRPQTTNVDTSGGRPFVWDAEHGMHDLIPDLLVGDAKRNALAEACAVFSINNNGEILGINRTNPGVFGPQLNFVLVPHFKSGSHISTNGLTR